MTDTTESTNSSESSLNHLSDQDKQNLMSKGLLFEQLLQSEKFQSFFRLNYDLVHTEDDSGVPTLYLVEVPDSVALERAREEMKSSITKAPVIVPATEADARKITKKKFRK